MVRGEGEAADLAALRERGRCSAGGLLAVRAQLGLHPRHWRRHLQHEPAETTPGSQVQLLNDFIIKFITY